MESLFTRILEPVKRQGAERYLRLTLLAFAASVILTRLFLSLTGYPQVGGGTLHIAHLLWGGLLLFAASLLPLIFSNRWVYATGGVLSGLGVGLFVDEVGKFITRNNDYFYPAAAPIIYAFFLLTVLLYTRVRRPPSEDPRAEMYRAFDDMAEVLDHDLDPRERRDLEARLKAVAGGTAQPDYARLARVLLEFLDSDAVTLAAPVPGSLARLAARARDLEARRLTRSRFRALLAAGLIAVGLFSLGNLALLAAPQSLAPAQVERQNIELSAASQAAEAVGQPASPAPGVRGQEVSPGRLQASTFRAQAALWLRVGLEALLGLLLLAAAYFLLRHKDLRGVALGVFSLLLALTTVNLLVFYFDQFAAAAGALVQFALYQALVHYRRRYLASAGRGQGDA